MQSCPCNRDVDNEELVTFSGGDDIKLVNSHDLSGRLMVSSTRFSTIFPCGCIHIFLHAHPFFYLAW
jgi:hypothetical protein